MKVLMLGDSQVGKTTYMASMYGFMADDKGFNIAATRDADRKALDRLARRVRRGEYPSRSEFRSEYNFEFRYTADDGDRYSLFNFDWIDYRGGAIHQRENDPIAADLSRYLNEAQALIVFWDCSTLDSNDRQIRRQWMRIKQLTLAYAARANENTPLALTFLLTKQALIPDGWAETKIGSDLCNFLDMLAQNQYLHGMAAFSEINEDSIGNVYFPFLHSMKFGFRDEMNRRVARCERDHSAYYNRSIWGDIKAWWTDNDPELNRLNASNAHMQELDVLFNSALETLKEQDGEGGYFLF